MTSASTMSGGSATCVASGDLMVAMEVRFCYGSTHIAVVRTSIALGGGPWSAS